MIVESSAKTKTLSGFLGREYKVIACGGHIADLPKDRLGIAVARDFEPEIVAVEGKVDRLKRGLQNAAEVYLASDPDREGEAIAPPGVCGVRTEPRSKKSVTC